MKNESYGLITHINRFDTEEKCREHLHQAKWGDGVQCPHCENRYMNYYLSSRDIWKCPKCKKQFSLTKDTIFEGTKIPLKTWFQAIYIFTTFKRGISSCQLAKLIEVQQKTAWFMLHRMREALNEENQVQLSGEVQIDETFIGPDVKRDKRLQKKYKDFKALQRMKYGPSETQRNRINKEFIKKGLHPPYSPSAQGKKRNGESTYRVKRTLDFDTMVLGMLESSGRVNIQLLGTGKGRGSKENIVPKLKTNISSDSVVITDENKVYNGLESHFKDKKSVNHKKAFCINGIHTNGIENVWKHLKKLFDGTYFHVSKHYLMRYLDEFAFRWNRQRESEKSLFDSFFDFVGGKRITQLGLNDYRLNNLAA